MIATARYRVFVSSTSLDLGDLRKQVVKFLGILPAELVAMEDFGSDESRPKELCLAKVAQCNVFVGIYAQRYGHIDAATGLSITELEYRHAAALLAEGRMRAMLLYVIDQDALWPVKFNDDNPDAVRLLRQFKEGIRRDHTVATFKEPDELPLLIMRDLIRKMDIGRQVLLPRTRVPHPLVTRLTRPIGMDVFGPEHAGLFRGRQRDLEALIRQVTSEPVSLLLGASGIGKSSLIQAGVLPELESLGWLVILLRPFENLRHSLSNQVWAQAIQGVADGEPSLHTVIQLCRQAHPEQMILLVFDQFEDVALPALRGEIPALLSDLHPLQGGADGRLRMLFSYRSDAEGDIGPLWQRLSRSTGKYARTYLAPLGHAESVEAMATLVRASGTADDLDADETATVVGEMARDVAEESARNGIAGVYPPYLQIVLNEVVAQANLKNYSLLAAYRDLGGTHKIVQDFLMEQLRHFGSQVADARRVLVALVRSLGTKTQRKTEEIADEVQLDAGQLSDILQRLMDLRLVRQVESGYEVAHDFLARRIIAEATTSDEIVRKRSRELLESKVSAFTETGALLSLSEYLFLYRGRESMRVGLQQIVYLMRSAIPLQAPACFWLKGLDAEQVAQVLSQVEADEHSLRGDRLVASNTAPATVDMWTLTRYGVESPLRHAREDAIAELSNIRDLARELSSLSGRTSARGQYAAARLRMLRCADKDVAWCLKNLNAKTVAARCDAAIGLAHHPSAKNLELLLACAHDGSMRFHYACGYAAGCIATALGRHADMLSEHRVPSPVFFSGVIAAVGATARDLPAECLLPLLVSRRDDVLLAMSNLMGRGMDVPWHLLNDDEVGGRLYSNELLVAAAASGDGDEVMRYVESLRACESVVEVAFSHSPIAFAAATLGTHHRARIRRLMTHDAFGWDFDDRLTQPPVPDPRRWRDAGDGDDDIPDDAFDVDALYLATTERDEAPSWIACEANSYYLRWLVGCLFAMSAVPEDVDLLYRLARHPYWHIRSSALDALARFLGIQHMPRLIEELESIRESKSEIVDGLLGLARKLDSSAYLFVDPAPAPAPAPAPDQDQDPDPDLPTRTPRPKGQSSVTGFDDMDDDIPF